MRFLDSLEGDMNQRMFENKEQSVHALKSLFLSIIFFLWLKLCIDEGSMPLIDFVDWLDSC